MSRAGFHGDGTYSRRYTCRSHARDRDPRRCDAPRTDADILEPMFVLATHHLLPADTEPATPHNTERFPGHWTEAPEREQLREAALAGDEQQLNESIEHMAARVMPELAIHRRLTASRRQTRRETLARRLHAWAETRGQPPTDERRHETLRLNAELHEWFTAIKVHNAATETVFTAQPRPCVSEARYPAPAEFRLGRGAWSRASHDAGRRPRRPASWSNDEILAALGEWALLHGRAPNSSEWIVGSPDRPGSLCVRRRFGSWDSALKCAGLTPNARRQGHYWTDEELIHALKAWATRHGRTPTATDWTKASPAHPCARTVYIRYGTFGAAVAAAGLRP